MEISRTSFEEAKSRIETKGKNLVIRSARPDTLTVIWADLDFLVEGPEPFTHADIKIPMGSEILRRQNQAISLKEVAYSTGKKIVKQKHRFVGKENGPASFKNVVHVVDLSYVPINEKTIIRENILAGARSMGSDAGIFFINDK